MRKLIPILMFLVTIAAASVVTGTALLDEASLINAAISVEYRPSSYTVQIEEDDNGDFNYIIEFDGRKDMSKFLAAVIGCGNASKYSMSSGFIAVGFAGSGDLCIIYALNARYYVENVGWKGNDWGASYLAQNLTQTVYTPSVQATTHQRHYPEPVPRVTRPNSSAIWVTGISEVVSWTDLVGSDVTISIVNDIGRRINLGSFANDGSARVSIGNDFPDSEFNHIEIMDATGSVYNSPNFEVTHVLLESPRFASSLRLPRVINEWIEWETSAEEVRISLWFENDEVMELSNGWITSSGESRINPSGINRVRLDVVIPDSLPPTYDYRIAIQARNYNGVEYTDISRKHFIEPSDNTCEGAIEFSGETVSGTINYIGDVDYWRVELADASNRYRRFDFVIEGPGNYRMQLLSHEGEVLEETTRSNLSWETDERSFLYLRIEDASNSVSGEYSLSNSVTVVPPPEPHLIHGYSIGYDSSIMPDYKGLGMNFKYHYSPLRFIELQLGGRGVLVENSKFYYADVVGSLCTPRLSRLQLLVGASYSYRVVSSIGSDYDIEIGSLVKEDFLLDEESLEGGFNPCIGLDVVLQNPPVHRANHAGSAIYLRASAYFSEMDLQRISLGLLVKEI